MATRASHTNTPVVIIGAGISGICTAIDLIKRNNTHDFIIVEKGSQVGGTWNDNKYPGCCCDVWSHLYSYSFEPNPDWSYEYSGQEEILRYLVHVAEKWGLFQKIRFNTAVSEARWSDSEGKWKTRVQVTGQKEAEYGKEYVISSDLLVSAVGQLNMPQYPDYPGVDAFQGKIMHSARWDWSYPLERKRVAVIGNGATAAQIIPEVAKTCETLTVFQRTPNWVVPKLNAEISETTRRAYRYVPGLRSAYRARLMDIRETIYQANVVENSEAKKQLKKECLAVLEKQIPNNPELRKRLTPNYPPGCKRIIMSDDYLLTLNQPHVILETNHIEKFTPTGIIVEGGKKYELDVVVFATGFRTLEFMYPIKIFGEGGRPIEDIWKNRTRAYLGMSVESLPNFAMLYGPNTNLGHNSVILMIEAQSRYINTLISAVLKAKAKGERISITPSRGVIEEYNKDLQARLQLTTFANPQCHSWYKGADGTVTNNWCGTVVEYQQRTSEVNWSDYDIKGTGAHLPRELERKTYIGRVVEESRYLRSALYISATVGAILLLQNRVKGLSL